MVSKAIRGRKGRDATKTRLAILEAAKTLFAERGYANTGLREIAAAAGISLALVNRYYGSKEALFEIALKNSMDMSHLLDVDRAHFGAHVARIYCELDTIPRQFSMMFLSASEPAAIATSTKLINSLVIKPLAEWLGPPRAEERAMEIHVLLQGFFISLHFLTTTPRTDNRTIPVRRWFENAVQAIVDQGRTKARPSAASR
jgi:AcrR family transcriptional regulator